MAKRPKLSRQAVLRYVFHPRTAPKPLGIRKSLVTSTKWKTSRKNSWNAMSVADQQAIIASGKQNDYLTGKITLAESRRILRPEAIKYKVAKPTRATVNNAIADRLYNIANNKPESAKYRSRPDSKGRILEKSPASKKHITEKVRRMNAETKRAAMNISSYEELVDFASDDNLIDDDGINPFWYH